MRKFENAAHLAIAAGLCASMICAPIATFADEPSSTELGSLAAGADASAAQSESSASAGTTAIVNENEAVVEVGTAEELNSAIKISTSGQTVRLSADIACDVKIEADANIVIDLAGHALTNSSKSTITNDGTLLLVDSSGGKGAVRSTLTRKYDYAVKNSSTGKLEIRGVKIEVAKPTALYNDRGLISSISDSVISGANDGIKNNRGTIEKIERTSVTAGGVALENSIEATLGLLADCTLHGGQNALMQKSKIAISEISGGSFTSNDDDAIVLSNNSAISKLSTTVKSEKGAAVRVSDNSSLNIQGGSYTSAAGESAIKLQQTTADSVNVVISGGSFSDEVPARFVAADYAVLVNEQGSGTVMTVADAKAKAVAFVEKDGKKVYYTSQQAAEDANPGEGENAPQINLFPASIEGKRYETVASAIAEANGKTVTLLTDVEENITVPSGMTLTLDLAGNTLSGGMVSNTAAITNDGSLTLTDSSNPSTGCVIREDNGAQGYYTILNHGEMTILSGSVYNKTGDMPMGSSLICNLGTADKPATLNIKGGDIKQDGFIAVKNDDYGVLNITGGSISTTGNTATHTASAVQNFHNATISGGKISGAVWTSVWKDDLPAAKTVITGDVEITGDIIVKRHDSYPGGKTPEVEITGGILNIGTWNIAEEDAVVQVSGGTFIDEPPADEFIVPGSGLVKDKNGNLVVAVAKLSFVSDKVIDGVFSYDVKGGKADPVTEAELLKLVGVNVEGYAVSVDASALPALNKAIGAADTSTEFSFKFTASKNGASNRAVSGVEPLVLKVRLVDSTVEPAPEPAETATVTFDTGLGSSFAREVKVGSKLERPVDPVHDGWKFVGWFTEKAADGTLSGEWDFGKSVVDGDMTLYGGWIEIVASDAGEKPAAKPALPQTGDASMLPVVVVGAAGVAAVAAGAIAAAKRRKAE